jgi:hypothetical protein
MANHGYTNDILGNWHVTGKTDILWAMDAMLRAFSTPQSFLMRFVQATFIELLYFVTVLTGHKKKNMSGQGTLKIQFSLLNIMRRFKKSFLLQAESTPGPYCGCKE